MSTTATQSHLTTTEVAERLGVDRKKIGELIRAGELIAINVAVRADGERPRWRITIEEVERWEKSRSTAPQETPARPRRRRSQDREFF